MAHAQDDRAPVIWRSSPEGGLGRRMNRAKYDWRTAILGCWTGRGGRVPHPPWLNKKPKTKASWANSQDCWRWPGPARGIGTKKSALFHQDAHLPDRAGESRRFGGCDAGRRGLILILRSFSSAAHDADRWTVDGPQGVSRRSHLAAAKQATHRPAVEDESRQPSVTCGRPPVASHANIARSEFYG